LRLGRILPIANGFGAAAESRRPMGVAVVGGMLTSTFLTLVIIPVVYTLFSNLAARFHRKPVEHLSAVQSAQQLTPVSKS
jgi:HAE1 family hydrophobic/amphiphilic exporter-1